MFSIPRKEYSKSINCFPFRERNMISNIGECFFSLEKIFNIVECFSFLEGNAEHG